MTAPKQFFTNLNPEYKDKNIGDYTYGLPTLAWWSPKCRIGKFCSIAWGVTIFGGGEHRPDWVTTYPFSALTQYFPFAKDFRGHPASKGPTILQNDIWIGHGATILSGVTVGNGAVIGAKSLVVKDVPPYAIVAGNPARLIRYRFSEEQIEKLQAIAWWDLDLKIISSCIGLLLSDQVDLFIQVMEGIKALLAQETEKLTRQETAASKAQQKEKAGHGPDEAQAGKGMPQEKKANGEAERAAEQK